MYYSSGVAPLAPVCMSVPERKALGPTRDPHLNPRFKENGRDRHRWGVPFPFDTMQDKAHLRDQLRRARARLTPKQQAQAGRRAAARLARLPRFTHARRIAAYVARGGELNPAPALALARRRGLQCYLPVLHPGGQRRLLFARWREGARMKPNRYGIPEPQTRIHIAPCRLDIVLVPLVGFDLSGTRLGMGGGYYDRTFAFRSRMHRFVRPLLVGYAHACQRTGHLPRSPWDVALDWVVTDKAICRVNRHNAFE